MKGIKSGLMEMSLGWHASVGVKSIVQLHQCSCVGSKPKELEAIVQQENQDTVPVTERYWDDSHDWGAAMDGYKHFRRDRQGRRGGGVALYIRECFVCRKLKNSDDKVECLWVRKGGRVARQASWWESITTTQPG